MKKYISFVVMSLIAVLTLHLIDNVASHPQYANPWDWVLWFDLDYRSILVLWLIALYWVTAQWSRFYDHILQLDLDEHPAITAPVNRGAFWGAVFSGYYVTVKLALNLIVGCFIAALVLGIESSLHVVFQIATMGFTLRWIGVSPVDTKLLATKPEYAYLQKV